MNLTDTLGLLTDLHSAYETLWKLEDAGGEADHEKADKIKSKIAKEYGVSNTRGGDTRPTTITVHNKCTIVLLVGHGGSRRTMAHKFDPLPKNCRVGFIGCTPGATNDTIKSDERLPGVPTDYKRRLRSLGEAFVQGKHGDLGYGPEIAAAYRASLEVSNDMCCECPETIIIFTSTNKVKDPNDPSPFGKDVIMLYSCATGEEIVLQGDSQHILTGKRWKGRNK